MTPVNDIVKSAGPPLNANYTTNGGQKSSGKTTGKRSSGRSRTIVEATTNKVPAQGTEAQKLYHSAKQVATQKDSSGEPSLSLQKAREQRLTVSLYGKVWFGTEVWDNDGHDILRAYRVWGSVRSVITS